MDFQVTSPSDMSKSSYMSASINALMSDVSSPAVETGALDEISAATVSAVVRPQRVWPNREARAWRYPLLRRMLATADVTAALVATLGLGVVGDVGQFAWALVCLPSWVVLAKVLGLYDYDQHSLRHLTVDEVPLLVVWTIFGTIGALAVPTSHARRSDECVRMLSGLRQSSGSRSSSLRVVARRVWRVITPPERVAIIGSGPEAAAFRRKLELFPDLHMTIVEEHDALDIDEARDRDWLETVDRLVFAPASLDDQDLRETVERSRAAGVRLTVVPPYRGALGSSVQLSHIAELPLLEYETGDLARSTLFLKRTLDLVVSSVLLVVLLPLFVRHRRRNQARQPRACALLPAYGLASTDALCACSSSAQWSPTPKNSFRTSFLSTSSTSRCSSFVTIPVSRVSDARCGGGASTSSRSSGTCWSET